MFHLGEGPGGAQERRRFSRLGWEEIQGKGTGRAMTQKDPPNYRGSFTFGLRGKVCRNGEARQGRPASWDRLCWEC